jgi:hypothetical protein
MTTSKGRAQEVLYDSETVLRLVDRELNELREPEPSHATLPDAHMLPSNTPAEAAAVPDISGFLTILRQANDEISQVLGTLRSSRQALQGVTLDRLHDSTAKILEVSSATETAATDILDGLDRSQGLLDQLDEIGATDAEAAATIRKALRDELFAMMGPLQFQDITTQQLSHASSMLIDVEARLRTIAKMLGGAKLTVPEGQHIVQPFAESASTRYAAERQAEADALFAPSPRVGP